MERSTYLKYGNFLNWTGFIQKCNEQENENLNSMLNTLVCLEQRISELDTQKDMLEKNMKNFENKIVTEIDTFRSAIDNKIEQHLVQKEQKVLHIINNQMSEFNNKLQKHKEVLGVWQNDNDSLVSNRMIQMSHSRSLNALRNEKKKIKLIYYFNFYAMAIPQDDNIE